MVGGGSFIATRLQLLRSWKIDARRDEQKQHSDAVSGSSKKDDDDEDKDEDACSRSSSI